MTNDIKNNSNCNIFNKLFFKAMEKMSDLRTEFGAETLHYCIQIKGMETL